MDGKLQKLITDSQAGDRQAQEQLILAVQNHVYYHCCKMLRNEDDALDATQEILISLLRGLPSLREPAAFWPWLNQITCRFCYKQHTRRRLFLPFSAIGREETFCEEADDQMVPDRALDTEENRRMVRELVDALPEVQRLCILMYYYDEMSVKDISAALDISEGTVKSRLHYARQRIKKGAEAYAAQGSPLCGVLPFLRYFLQQEASSCGLGAAAKSLAGAVLAAGSGAAAAVSGAAAAGTAGLAGRGALVLAGAALAAVIAGGTLLPRREAPPPPAPPEVRQEEPAPVPESPLPAEPDAPEPAAPEPEPAPPEAPPPARTVPLVHTEPEPDRIGEPDPVLPPVPEEEVSPPPLLPAEPLVPSEPVDFFISLPAQPLEPEPEPEPERPYIPPVYRPDPDPLPVEPDPGPVEPDPGPVEPDPGPVEPDPPELEPIVYERPFTDSLQNGGYGYTATFSQAWGDYLAPVKMTYSSSDPAVVAVNEEGVFTTLAPGTAVVSALDENHDGAAFRYDLAVTVEDHFCWKYSLPDVSIEQGQTELNSIESYHWSRPEDYNIEIAAGEWTSSDPDTVQVKPLKNPGACAVSGLAPGTATVSGRLVFQLDTAGGPKTMEDTLSFQVTVAEPSKPEEPEPPGPDEPETVFRKEVTQYGEIGYGFTLSFPGEWGETLPGTLVYTSSDPKVAAINAEGRFTTLSAGTAELTAVAPDDPGCRYVLKVHVADHFQWFPSPVTTTCVVGKQDSLRLAGEGSWSGHVVPKSAVWTSSDPSILEAAGTYWMWCGVLGRAPGTVTITGVITFEVETVVGTKTMQDTVTFQVTVTEAE